MSKAEITTGKSKVEYYSMGFPKRRNYFRDMKNALHFTKMEMNSCQLGKETNKRRMLPFRIHSRKGMWEK